MKRFFTVLTMLVLAGTLFSAAANGANPDIGPGDKVLPGDYCYVSVIGTEDSGELIYSDVVCQDYPRLMSSPTIAIWYTGQNFTGQSLHITGMYCGGWGNFPNGWQNTFSSLQAGFCSVDAYDGWNLIGNHGLFGIGNWGAFLPGFDNAFNSAAYYW